MKAVLCKAFGPAETLVLEEVASPVIKKNEILLDVHAAGVNFPDTLIIEGKYQFKPPFPFSPGGEAAGVVSEVGEKVSHLKVGDRVMALTGWGSFAEQVAVPGYNVLPYVHTTPPPRRIFRATGIGPAGGIRCARCVKVQN